MTEHRSDAQSPNGETGDFITVWIGEQLFGLPILRVQDVFTPDRVTQVPLSLPEVAGVLNLRGRIVTSIDMRRRLGLPPRTDNRPTVAVGIEVGNESYGLVIDEVGDVVSLDESTYEANPSNLDPRWAQIATGVHRLDGQLMMVLDVERVFSFAPETQAA